MICEKERNEAKKEVERKRGIYDHHQQKSAEEAAAAAGGERAFADKRQERGKGKRG